MVRREVVEVGLRMKRLRRDVLRVESTREGDERGWDWSCCW